MFDLVVFAVVVAVAALGVSAVLTQHCVTLGSVMAVEVAVRVVRR